MNSVLGSQFEATLRIPLLLEASGNETLTEGAIAAIDHIAVYSRDFGLSKVNLHGESKYRFGEFASRRKTVKAAIKQLVLDGLVVATRTSGGFNYRLSADGADFAESLDTEYADAYFESVKNVVASAGKSEGTLGEIINRKSIESIREG